MIGPNGAGKTTLFRMIVGAGAARRRRAARSARRSSSPTSTSRRDALDPEKTVWEEISDGYEHIKVGDREVNSRAYVAGFNFKGSDQQRKVGALSGGERNRVHLAKLLRRGGNVLLLDEPTNDLDVDTLRALEEALLAFPGCAVIISHDRWFLDRVATHVLAFEGDSQVTLVRGQLRGLRGAPARAARRRGRPAAPDHVQEAHARVAPLPVDVSGRPRNRSFRRPRSDQGRSMHSRSSEGRRCRRTAFVAALALAATVAVPVGASAYDWQSGDVFVGLSSGQYNVYDNGGTLHETINQASTGPNHYAVDCAFDRAGVLHTTAYTVPAIDRFLGPAPHNPMPQLTGLSAQPESISFARDGSFYVGHIAPPACCTSPAAARCWRASTRPRRPR